jgi:hypothetical protein
MLLVRQQLSELLSCLTFTGTLNSHYSISIYRFFFVSERTHVLGCATAHSKANVTLMSEKIEAFLSDSQKLRNYAISGDHC